MEELQIKDAIKKIKNGKKRNFVESVDVIFSLHRIDLKKPESKFTEEVVLPAGRGKDARVGVIGKTLVVNAKGVADELINDDKLDELEKNKSKLKSLVNDVDFFIAEAPYMLRIGKSLGRVLGPKGKMPKPLPPNADPKPMIERLRKTVQLKLRNNPVVQTLIGKVDMSDEDLIKNYEAVYSSILKKLPLGKDNIKAVYIKTTMGKPVKIKN